MQFLKILGTAAKAFMAALIAFLTALLVPLVGDVGIGELTDGQWVAVALATVSAFGVVYGVPNARSQNPDTSTPGPDVHPHEHGGPLL